MPYSKAPDRIKGLPSHAKSIWVAAFNSAYKQYNGDEEKSNATAWAAVKKAGYQKGDKGWVKASEGFNYLYCLKETSKLPDTIEIMREGKWKHPIYNKLEITGNTIENIITNFKNNVRGVDISFDLEHGGTNHKSEAVCWVKNLIKKGSKLLAEVEWTDFGKEKIQGKNFKYFSPEFRFVYEDEETGKKYNNVLLGGGLTNKPFIKKMQPIMLSETVDENDLNSELYSPCTIENEKGDNSMNKELLKVLKLSETATEEEINAAVTKLSEDVVKLAELNTTIETLKAEKATLEDDKKALETEKTNLTVKLNDAINNKSTADQKIIALNEDIKNINIKLKEADWNALYTVALNEGKLLPAQEELFKAQYMANPEATEAIIKSLQPVVKLGENGSSNSKDDAKSYTIQFNEEATKIMKERKVDYNEAIILVAQENKELADNAAAERRGLI